jgi:hypothetical protein
MAARRPWALLMAFICFAVLVGLGWNFRSSHDPRGKPGDGRTKTAQRFETPRLAPETRLLVPDSGLYNPSRRASIRF